MGIKNKINIEVFYKNGNPEEKELIYEIKDLGLNEIKQVKYSRIYQLEYSKMKDKQIFDRIAREILIDPVVEDFVIGEKKEKGIKIKVFFRPGVLDVEGQRVIEALDITKIKGISRARKIRKYTILPVSVPRDSLNFVAEKLLYNKVIEEIQINGCK